MVIFLYKSSDLELWKSWAKQQGRSNDLLVINHQDEDVINLLGHYKDKEVITAVNALMLLSGLSLGGSSSQHSEQYWEQATRQRLHRLLLLTKLSDEPYNITTIFQLHNSAPQTPEQLFDEELIQNSYFNQVLRKAASNVGEDDKRFKLVENYFTREIPYMADRTQSSILSLTSSILEPFISSPMLNRIFCGGTTVKIEDMFGGKIVILNLPIQQFEYSGKVAQIIFKYILQKQIEVRDLDKYPNPIIMWLDEYQHFITEYDYLFMSTARSSRAGCVLMTQNISNLFAQTKGSGRVSEEKVNSLLSLANHKFFLAQNSFVTNEFASKTIGMGKHQLGSTSVTMDNFQGNAGISESYHYEIMPREFTMLKRGGEVNNGIVEAVITATGKRFSNGKNYLKIAFKQPWVKSK